MFGIFTISAATLFLEIAFSRLFSAVFFYHFSFLIVSTGLFGFGVSGVFLSILKPEGRSFRVAGTSALLFALSVPLALKAILVLPLDINHELVSLWQASILGMRYLFLAMPFFFAGTAIGVLLSETSLPVSRLYFWDLVGAACGCAFPALLVPRLGAPGAILAAALLGATSALYFSWKAASKWRVVVALIALVGLCALSGTGLSRYFAVPIDRVMATKHPGFYRISQGVEFSGWSPISRIDVLRMPRRKVIYIDGGSNVSFMVPFDGNWAATPPRRHWRSLPYLLGTNQKVLIIGPSGGEDVLTALTHRVASVTGVELDPLINRLVTGRYSDLIGRIYSDPRVMLITDEGRSFLRRDAGRYDVIQQVHNISPVAFASGAMNLSETYLLTKEAMGDYLDHLTDRGVLCINRWGTIRIASIALSVLEERGYPKPGRHFAILESGERRGNTNAFLLKKSPLTPADLSVIRDFARRQSYRISYLPGDSDPSNPYVRMLSPSGRKAFFAETGLNLFPPTDDRPFFDHFLPFARSGPAGNVGKDVTRTIPFMNSGDFVVLGVLAESLVFSTLLLLLPLWLRYGRKGLAGGRSIPDTLYFFSLGVGFILIEVTLVQKFILYLGNPATSLAAVLFALLSSAGLGSEMSRRLASRMGEDRASGIACGAVVAWMILYLLLLGPLLRVSIGLPFALRLLMTCLLLGCAGMCMGMPFPLGISALRRRSPTFVPWAWGVNGYATVLGSAVCVIIAVTAGFKAVLTLAAAFYLLAAFTRPARA